tara:strand:- start:216 stop:422 length:207 start_codon:yes stop_codon:yes gene_type:complete
MGKKKTTKIAFGSGNTEQDGVNAHMAKGDSDLVWVTLSNGKRVQVEAQQPDPKDRTWTRNTYGGKGRV